MSKVRMILVECDDASPALFASLLGLMGMGAGVGVTGEIPGALAAVPAFSQPVAPEPSALETPRVAVPKKQAPPLPPMPKAQPAPKAASVAPREDAAPAKVLELLAKKPMTSGELIKALAPKCSAPAIYSALSQFRQQGKIRMIEDPETVQKKNALV